MYCLITHANHLIMNTCDLNPKVVVLSKPQTLRLLYEKHEVETLMAQARTLDDAQIKRLQRYLRTRRNYERDSTIFTFAFNTGLRAKELAALCVGDAYDAQGAVRDAFVLQRSQTKGARTRTVYINRTLRVVLEQYRTTLYSTLPTAPLFESRKGGHFSANTMCQLFLNVFADCELSGAPHTHRVAHSSPNLPTKV